jgi:exopolysaccharide biosynthesis WecB/TagA/CpsF family protein
MEIVNLLGVDFEDLTVDGVVRMLLARRAAARFTYVVTPNADHLARLRRLPQLRGVYQAAWLRVLDSQMLRHAARRLGLHAPHVATGADITQALLAALPPCLVAVVGLQPKYLPALQARYPQLRFLHHAPPPDLLHDDAAFRRARDFVVASGARFTFLAVGSPVQELLAYAVSLQPGGTGVGLCVGAALDYQAGAQTRAPGWMRQAGLEWLYRLAGDPRRLARRYLLDDLPVLFDLLAARFSRTARRSPPGPHPRSAPAAIAATGPYPPPLIVHLHEIPDAG